MYWYLHICSQICTNMKTLHREHTMIENNGGDLDLAQSGTFMRT